MPNTLAAFRAIVTPLFLMASSVGSLASLSGAAADGAAAAVVVAAAAVAAAS